MHDHKCLTSRCQRFDSGNNEKLCVGVPKQDGEMAATVSVKFKRF